MVESEGNVENISGDVYIGKSAGEIAERAVIARVSTGKDKSKRLMDHFKTIDNTVENALPNVNGINNPKTGFSIPYNSFFDTKKYTDAGIIISFAGESLKGDTVAYFSHVPSNVRISEIRIVVNPLDMYGKKGAALKENTRIYENLVKELAGIR